MEFIYLLFQKNLRVNITLLELSLYLVHLVTCQANAMESLLMGMY